MQHTHLTSDKWKLFSIDKQILMIANELNRAKNWIEKEDFDKVSSCYERAFELIDLTVECSKNNNFIRELLRYREQLALSYMQNGRVFDNALYRLLLHMNVSSCNVMNTQ
jgi:hypothetical protein